VRQAPASVPICCVGRTLTAPVRRDEAGALTAATAEPLAANSSRRTESMRISAQQQQLDIIQASESALVAGPLARRVDARVEAPAARVPAPATSPDFLDQIHLDIDRQMHGCTCTGMIRSSQACGLVTPRTSQGDSLPPGRPPVRGPASSYEPGSMVVTPGYLLPLARELRFQHDENLSAVHEQRRDALKLLALWEELEELHAQVRFWKTETQRTKRPNDQFRSLVGSIMRIQRATVIQKAVQGATPVDATSSTSAETDTARISEPPKSALKKTEPGEVSAACMRARQHADMRRQRVAQDASVELGEGNAPVAEPFEHVPEQILTPRTRMVTWC